VLVRDDDAVINKETTSETFRSLDTDDSVADMFKQILCTKFRGFSRDCKTKFKAYCRVDDILWFSIISPITAAGTMGHFQLLRFFSLMFKIIIRTLCVTDRTGVDHTRFTLNELSLCVVL
jgi:hypothetical protein